MGNSQTVITSNWFEVTDIELVEHLVALDKELLISIDANKVKLAMDGGVNWDKCLNNVSIFVLLAGLLAEGETMQVDEIVYMDGRVVGNELLSFSAVPFASLAPTTHPELIQQLGSSEWTVVVKAINRVQEQAGNICHLCSMMGIPLAYLNCFNYDMWSSDRIRYLRTFSPACTGIYGDAVVAFLVYQCITLAWKDCGDIGKPAKESEVGTVLLWSCEDFYDSFTDGWDDVESLLETINEWSDTTGQAPKFMADFSEYF